MRDNKSTFIINPNLIEDLERQKIYIIKQDDDKILIRRTLPYWDSTSILGIIYRYYPSARWISYRDNSGLPWCKLCSNVERQNVK